MTWKKVNDWVFQWIVSLNRYSSKQAQEIFFSSKSRKSSFGFQQYNNVRSSHRRCSIKNAALKSSQYLQENSCVSLLKRPQHNCSGRVELWTWNLAQRYSLMLQIKWHKKNFNMVTSVVMTSLIIRTLAQNYAKKCKNGTISKIEIVRVRKKIFYFSFQFLKAKRS